jgi:ubiquinone/menaquinone biosynthesis C-methylase UbiE
MALELNKLKSPMATECNYILGQSQYEYERLTFQAGILRPLTEKFFRLAGVNPEMRVLEIGSGMGDVAFLAGEIVGPGGRVLGVDQDAAGLEKARERSRQQGCSSWVTFEGGNLAEFQTADQFDAIVGRYILLYQQDPGAIIRRLLKFLKPRGIVVFHETDFANAHSSDPPCAFWDEIYALLSEAFRRAGSPPDYGRRVASAFLDAGLPFPTVLAESVVGGGRDSCLYRWVANTVISITPRLEEMGLALPEGVRADETLARRLEDEVVAAGSQILGPIQFGAWTRKAPCS